MKKPELFQSSPEEWREWLLQASEQDIDNLISKIKLVEAVLLREIENDAKKKATENLS